VTAPPPVFFTQNIIVPGDYGAWILDKKTNQLYGHIVAGDPHSCLAYIIPTHKVFEDLKTRFDITPDFSLGKLELSLSNVVFWPSSLRSNSTSPRQGSNLMSSSQDRSLYDATNNPTSRNEIRLLRIEQAADRGAELRCSLFLESLDSNPEYFALSYMWGDDKVKVPILVNNILVSVTLNLEAALRYIRQEDKPTIFWIDALCINQMDIKDKESHLPLMGSIYSKARTVYVYTGHEDDDSRNTFELIRRWTAGLDPSFNSIRHDAWDLHPKCEKWFGEQN
jgi:hypothetical protein